MGSARNEELKVCIDLPQLNAWRRSLNWQLADLATNADLSQRTLNRVYETGRATFKTHRAILRAIRIAIVDNCLPMEPPTSLALTKNAEDYGELSTASVSVVVDTQVVFIRLRIPELQPETVTPEVIEEMQKKVNDVLARCVSPVRFEKGSLKITYEVSPEEAERLGWSVVQGLFEDQYQGVESEIVDDIGNEGDETDEDVDATVANQLAHDLRRFQILAAEVRKSLHTSGPFADRCNQAFSLANDLFGHAPIWTCFFREVLAVGGLTHALFPTPDEYAEFMCASQYDQIQQMLTALRSRDLPESDPNDPQRMITVRLPKSLHESLCAEAAQMKVSINRLCISRFLQVLDQKMVPEKAPRLQYLSMKEDLVSVSRTTFPKFPKSANSDEVP